MKLEDIFKLPSAGAAPALLGWIICRQTPIGAIKLKIVETEAYHQNEPASHSYHGLTARTAPMFESGGRLYVYFTYGMHHALNLVVGPKGVGPAVLIRAAEPLEGLEIMQANRGLTDIKRLANGPGKLAQALGISDTKLSGKILDESSIFLEPPDKLLNAEDIITSSRIGISKAVNLPWRFFIKNSPYVSHSRRQAL